VTEYDGLLVQVVPCPVHGARVVVAVGDDGEYPAAGHFLCPTDGVDGLIAALRKAQAVAAPMHIAHGAEPGFRPRTRPPRRSHGRR
jgi:hypothetical protein